MRFELAVDGRPAVVEVDPATPLLHVLRNELGLAGPKLGCGLGQCGSCSVLLDGEVVRSCVRRMSSVPAGATVTTVAGLGSRERPHPVQAAFVAEQALQCGYCTSGMIVAAAALLRENPDPGDAEIRAALERNLCRCGAHERIVRAVRRAASSASAAVSRDALALPAAPSPVPALAAAAAAAAWVVGRDDGIVPERTETSSASNTEERHRGACRPCMPGSDVREQLACSPAALRTEPSPTRRAVLAGGGFLLLGFCLGGRAVLGQPPPAGAPSPGAALPGSLARHRRLDAWLRVGADGTVTVLSGKVELGQGIRTALAQIVADELDVAIERLEMVSADTELSPDEGYTSGSVSIQQSGAALRQAAAEARLVLLELASARLEVPVEELAVEDGSIGWIGRATATADAGAARGARHGGSAPATSYWELVTDTTLQLEATGRASPKPRSARRLVGRPVPRLDVPAKVFGEPAFVHDLRLEGTLHARVVRPPSYGARLASLDETAARALPGVVQVVRDGSFLAVLAEREEQAEAAAETLARAARWSGAAELPDRERLVEHLRGAPSRAGRVASRGPEPASAAAAAAVTLEAEYSKPFLAHASLAPSCAVALAEGDRLRVWTHSQGVFPLRAALSRVLAMPAERLRVTHVEGSGCYGHNGADDVACDAALVARAVPGRPVRVQWSREDELRWAPFGSAMAIRVRGGIDREGGVTFFASELWSHTHSTRPGREPGFVAAWHLASPLPPPTALNIPGPAGGEDRNAVPLYDFPSLEVIEHFLPDMPVRVSALRSLGAYANVFAIESFVDELAAAAGADPVAFRLRHLSEPRARGVIETAARAAAWTGPSARRAETSSSPSRGRGFAFAQYKNQASYVALVVDVAVDPATGEIRLERATAAVDAGDVVNPDGLRNQIEGGIVQAASWTLLEEVAFDRERITSTDWRSYPIARFLQVPEVSVTVIERPDDPPVGAGEAAQGPTAAAIANAVFAATGVRRRDLPLAPARSRPILGRAFVSRRSTRSAGSNRPE